MKRDVESLKGNKGEWSEVYVLLKLLAEGRLNAADANLNAIPDIYYPIIKILRDEISTKREFVIDDEIEIIDGDSQTLIMKVPIPDFIHKSNELFEHLRKVSGRSFSFSEIETFLKSIEVNSVAALKSEKSDIRIVVHDLNTGLKPTLGFSIKSMIGKDSTLFNPGPGTNFIYKIDLPQKLQPNDLKKFNAETLLATKGKKTSKISLRLTELEKLGCRISFHSIQSQTLYHNLQLIDSQLPGILAHLILYKYKLGKSKLSDLISEITIQNPLKFDLSQGHPFYEYKIKNFLTENALGMTPETVWTGVYDATGGIIIVKSDGDIVCYHIYNKKEFQDYLINNTRLEQASTSEDDENPGFPRTPKRDEKIKPYKFGWIYEEDGNLYIKLNLQIRFS